MSLLLVVRSVRVSSVIVIIVRVIIVGVRVRRVVVFLGRTKRERRRVSPSHCSASFLLLGLDGTHLVTVRVRRSNDRLFGRRVNLDGDGFGFRSRSG